MYRLSNKILSWIPQEDIEEKALEQIKNISEMPFIFNHIAVMPDCHLGKGATVGSCIPTSGAIIPAAVGVDIGCGMVAVKTPLFKKDLPEDLEKLHHSIERAIPLSAGKYNQEMTESADFRAKQLSIAAPQGSNYDGFAANWRFQIGTLGSGNHFIEIVLDEEDRVWVFLHSGSRGVGNKIAMHHIKIAQELMAKYHIKLVDKDLAYLVEGTAEFDSYIEDLQWAQNFALANREEMMDRVLTQLSYFVFNEDGHQKELELERIQCHHNFTQKENHMGKNVWISRKGAIQVQEGQLGLIPGSMGTASYVVRGLGNKASFDTAPHGAGRNFSRTEARKRFTMEDFDRDMKGIVVKRSKEFLDELPGAYKDINVVMERSKDIVKVEHKFRQIINVKGD